MVGAARALPTCRSVMTDQPVIYILVSACVLSDMQQYMFCFVFTKQIIVKDVSGVIANYACPC